MKLVVAEKPSVAKSIAGVLGANDKRNGYLEGNGYIVTWCYGHLVELAQPEEYKEEWKNWEYESLPLFPDIWKYSVKSASKDQFNIIKSLMKNDSVTSCVCATDAGREGEYIFRLVYDKVGCKKPIERLWISSLEDSAIKEGFEHLKPGSEFEDLYDSAKCRAKADWLVGINGSRLFTTLYKGTKLNVGRVQTPTLSMLVEREDAILRFVKEPFYTVHLYNSDKSVDALSEKFKDKSEAEKIAGLCNGYLAKVESVTSEEKKVSPPKLYDLTTLQRDANRLFGFTAQQTLDTMQSLYEKKLCTYPRTDAQFLTDDMTETATKVFEAVMVCILHDKDPFIPNVDRVLNSKKVTDHHAIIPTLEIAKKDLSLLSVMELKILFLVANRLVCAVSEPYVYESVKAVIDCQGNKFTAIGKTVLKDGFKAYEDSFRKENKADKDEEPDEKSLPKLSKGQTFEAATDVKESFTQPPKHFTEDSLLSAMERAGAEEMDDEVERKGLGTTATRAGIIEKLIHDGYVVREKKQLLPTENGRNLIRLLPAELKTPSLTAEWENNLVLVSKGELDPDTFMNGIENMVDNLVRTNCSPKDEFKEQFARESPANVIGRCPLCGGNVVSGKFGAYCSNKCKMNLSFVRGQKLSDAQVKNLLEGKKILVKGLKSKDKGTVYDAYFVPDGIEPYSYNGKDGFQFKINMEFPERKTKGGRK